MDARKLYEDLAGNSDSIGAYRFVSQEEENKFNFEYRQTTVAAEYINLEEAGLLKSNEEHGKLTFRVPSPWHAVIHLLVNSRSWLDGRVFFGRSSSLIYRGQGDVSWKLKPSIYREGIDINYQRKLIYAFTDIMERFLRFEGFTNILSPSLMLLHEKSSPKALHVATAQHYGIKTPLLDFTSDPAVAVWFACQEGIKIGAEEVVVYALPSRMAPVLKMVALFPHPYATRLYRQRGLFVEVLTANSPIIDSLREHCVEIRFPPDAGFKVLRKGAEIDLLDTDPFWAHCVSMAKKIVEDNDLDKLLKATDKEAYTSILPDIFEYPITAHADYKISHLRSMSREMIQSLLSLLICFKSDTPRVLKHGVRWISAGSRETLKAMYPLLKRELSAFPEDSPIKIAGMKILSELREQLGESMVYDWRVPW